MENNTNIKGDRNIVVQESENSRINIRSNSRKASKKEIYALIGLIIAVLGLFATIIIGWDNIINFFCK